MSTGNQDAPYQRPDPLAIFPLVARRPLQGLPSKVISHNSTYEFYGPFDQTQLAVSASEYIVSRSDASRKTISAELNRFLTVAAQDCYRTASPADRSDIIQSCWLTIRAYSATYEFKQPRWHRDGRMFDCTCFERTIPHSKYAFTLLGPSTLALSPSAQLDEAFDTARRVWQEDNRDLLEKSWKEGIQSQIRLSEKERPFLIERLRKFDPVPLKPTQIIRFSWGQPDSPVHSEPDSSATDRISSVFYLGVKKKSKICAKSEKRSTVRKKINLRGEKPKKKRKVTPEGKNVEQGLVM
ncbi:hypothetical protein BGW36DRAFT_93065 [Talaromyces proteolyticus]|uniref:Uncharacterized protein n=1 Tax=Talaromyces proteolyticus TaxID=1131652 RepID=A0AAD4L431_9EURO|nr:uncharacterized protein BGW36DRAFT_93065 [Talaromyces proteolyticus]KAH8703843.1 hypothetical protein BGW36DRAFT_93065 [Talaromyces proteolyticus]